MPVRVKEVTLDNVSGAVYDGYPRALDQGMCGFRCGTEIAVTTADARRA